MPATSADGVELVPFNESRWPPAAAVFMFMILNIAMRIWLPRGAAHCRAVAASGT
jgi:hypothetical protein